MTVLRSALFALWFYGCTTLFAVGSAFVRPAPDEVALAYSRKWAEWVLWGVRVLCGITWEVTGMEHLAPDEPVLIASMHQSAFDTVLWLILVPRPCFVLKQELARIPLFGGMCRRCGMIVVDRSAGASAMRGLLREADRARAEGRQVVIFPEGTRVAPGVRAKLHAGIAAMAVRTGLPVVPVATDSGVLWGRNAFRKKPGTIHVRILPPLPAGLSRDELMQRLGEVFAEGSAALGLPLHDPVDKSVGDGPRSL
jgi:1-acyl-sn-glycerol-3-phosphate acyltransferase